MSTVAEHSFARKEVTLANWRSSPFSTWSFQSVNEIVPSAMIAGNGLSEGPVVPLGNLASLIVSDPNGLPVSLLDFLSQSQTDSFVVMRDGAIVGEWYAPTCDRLKPHLLFSVSKSITGILAGILEDKVLLSTSDLVVRYVPEAAGSAYGDATVRHLLDMEVALDFNEDYLVRPLSTRHWLEPRKSQRDLDRFEDVSLHDCKNSGKAWRCASLSLTEHRHGWHCTRTCLGQTHSRFDQRFDLEADGCTF
jgi:CubicO group peptidase (beta-lactamase class C family)